MGSTAYGREMSTPPTLFLEYGAPFCHVLIHTNVSIAGHLWFTTIFSCPM